MGRGGGWFFLGIRIKLVYLVKYKPTVQSCNKVGFRKPFSFNKVVVSTVL